MKITDLALIFIGILLPMMIVVYVNVSFTIKAQEQEIYYKQIIDMASEDATNQMKEVENEDTTIDYGYSGSESNKISVNAQIAVDTFLNSLYNNFGIEGNRSAQYYLQLFIPAIAIIDYDGVQVSSIENYTDNTNEAKANHEEDVVEHALKPKTYYSYTYTIVKDGEKYKMVDGLVSNVSKNNIDSYHEVDFTMDDYITHRWYTPKSSQNDQAVKGFYINDEVNNYPLAGTRDFDLELIRTIADRLTEIRKDVIVDTVVREIAYAANKNNSYARSAGITYSFSFPTTTESELYGVVDNVGFMAFVQGLSVGNKYLNTKSYGLTSLELTTRYYFTIKKDVDAEDYEDVLKKYGNSVKLNLYHKTKKCALYQELSNEDKTGIKNISPKYVLSKQKAASAKIIVQIGDTYKDYEGFYPCPRCIP